MSPQSKEALSPRLNQAMTLEEYRRLQCVYLRTTYGYSSDQIAEMTGYHPASVRRIQSQYKNEGICALCQKPRGGRNRENMSLEDEKGFVNQFITKAEAGQIVEISEIHCAYEEKLGRKVGKSTVYAVLHRHHWRKVAPSPQHPKHDEIEADAFKKTSQPSSKTPRTRQTKEGFLYG